MKKSIDYLKKALEQLGTCNDAEKAKQLGISRSTLSLYKANHNKMDNYSCAIVARIIGVSELEVIAACQVERERSSNRKKLWQEIHEREIKKRLENQ